MFDFKAFLDLNRLKQREAAEYLGTSRERIAQVSTKRSKLPEEWAAKILSDGLYKIPDEDDPTTAKYISPYEQELNDGNSLKYYYELEASAGDVSIFFDDTKEIPFRRLYFPAFSGCMGLNVVGHSMHPTAKNGDIVAVHPTPVSLIASGEIYLIITRDGQRMIKRLVQCKAEDGTDAVRCISDNEDKSLYADFMVSAADVVNVYRVKGFVSVSVLA